MSSQTQAWITLIVAAVIAAGLAGADAFRFHAFGTTFDQLLVVGSLAALGIHVVGAGVVPAIRGSNGSSS